MLLSVVVYNHTLAPGQWLGAAVVFAGISVEAWVKRKGERVSASQRRCPTWLTTVARVRHPCFVQMCTRSA